MLTFTKGDLFDSNASVLINTVNCVGVMGAGVALAFKTKYPEMFLSYQKECRRKLLQTGRLHIWDDPSGVTIVNFPTKEHWREPSRYEYIETGLVALHDYLVQRGRVRVALPALGCGHGGLDWGRVSQMIREHLDDLEAEIEVFDPSVSRSIGRKTVREHAGRSGAQSYPDGVRAVTPDETVFPSALRGIVDTPVYAKGPLALLDRPLVAVLPSAKPTEREVKAALECIEAFANPGVTLLLGYGADVERPAIRVALKHGASVAISLAEGLVNFRIRRDLRDVWDDHRIVVFSTVSPAQRWSSAAAVNTRRLGLALAKIALITDPSPTWLQKSSTRTTAHGSSRYFYINYHTGDSNVRQVLGSFQAYPVGRSARSGLPNVTRLLRSLGEASGARAD